MRAQTAGGTQGVGRDSLRRASPGPSPRNTLSGGKRQFLQLQPFAASGFVGGRLSVPLSASMPKVNVNAFGVNVKPTVSLGATLVCMPKDPAEVFAERLRTIPYGQNGRIAAEAGVNQTTLAHWKRKDSKKNPTLKNIEGLARAFRKPIAWLFSEDKEPSSANPGPSPKVVAPIEPEEYVKIRLRCPRCDNVIEKTRIERPAAGRRRRRK